MGGNNSGYHPLSNFQRGHCYIKHIVSHAEYDKLTNCL
ncbi:hypothetical protein [Photorhabdus bodei]